MKLERTKVRPRAVVVNSSGLPIAAKDETTTAPEDDIAKRFVTIFEKGMAEKDDAIAQRDSTIAEKERIIAEKDATIARQEESIAYRDTLIAQRDKLIQDMKPMAEAFHTFLNEDGLVDMRTAAKEIGVPPKKFIDHLIGLRVLYRNLSGRYIPRERLMEEGYFKVLESQSDGGSRRTTTWVTYKGLEFLRALLTYCPMQTITSDG